MCDIEIGQVVKVKSENGYMESQVMYCMDGETLISQYEGVECNPVYHVIVSSGDDADEAVKGFRGTKEIDVFEEHELPEKWREAMWWMNFAN